MAGLNTNSPSPWAANESPLDDAGRVVNRKPTFKSHSIAYVSRLHPPSAFDIRRSLFVSPAL